MTAPDDLGALTEPPAALDRGRPDPVDTFEDELARRPGWVRAGFPKALLLLVGISGFGLWAFFCFFWVFSSIMAGGGFGGPSHLPSVFDYALVFAPLVTFASYIWIAIRPWKMPTLVLWGVVAHLPFLKSVLHAQEEFEIFVVAVGQIFAALVYANYVWSIRQLRSTDRPEQATVR